MIDLVVVYFVVMLRARLTCFYSFERRFRRCEGKREEIEMMIQADQW